MQQTERKPLFDLGQLVATPAALTALEKSRQNAMNFLSRRVNRVPIGPLKKYQLPIATAKTFRDRQRDMLIQEKLEHLNSLSTFWQRIPWPAATCALVLENP
jgi:hypothetical protein